jgi:nucleoside-diphosphate-sugar epimerase
VPQSKWFDLVQAVVRGQPVECRRGGKEVHVADVARAVDLLLSADDIAGQAYNCYDMYISQYDVVTLAKQITGSNSEIIGGQTQPKNQISTQKIRDLGMTFGGAQLLEETIRQLVDAAR